MSTTPWKPRIQLIQNGELVEEGVSNRPIIDLEKRTQSLKGSIENLNLTSGRLVYSGAPLSEGVLAGDFVYFDLVDEVFGPAMADLFQDPEKGRMIAGAKSRTVGLVLEKTSSTSGHILLSGRIDLSSSAFSIDDILDGFESGEFTSGPLYLSTRIPGKATPHRVFPSVQLGFFSAGESVVLLQHKDLFESHEHYRFDLQSVPSASQNFLQTGWTSFGETGDGVVKRVDYFNSGASAIPPPMIMCVRQASGDSIPEEDPVRVEIFHDSGLKMEVKTGGVEYDDPSSAATTTTDVPVQSWPDYGEWVAVPDTNLEIAFIRKDGVYSTTLADDANTHLTTTDMRFMVFLPTDLRGWTNSNTFDLSHQSGALYRYLIHGDSPLLGAFPPLPTSSAIIELNGVSLRPGSDFVVTHLGIFWMLGEFDVNDFAPWPADHSVAPDAELLPDNAKNLVISFLKSALDGMNSVVYSLKGIAPIRVSRCPDSADAVNGHLQVGIDLNLGVSAETPGVKETTLSGVSGVNFDRSTLVSELIEGSGCRLENITPNSQIPGKKVGAVRVSFRGLKFEGEISSVALRNAKEMISVAGTYIDFVNPSVSASGITASLKLPNEDFDPALTKLHVLGQFRGDLDVPGASSELTAIFKVVYHVIRPGFQMSAMNDSNAVAIQYWKVAFPAGYSATTILPVEYPFLSGSPEAFEINAATLVANPSSLVALDGGFKVGDKFVVLVDRVTQDLDSNVASYTGRVGLSSLRWILK